MAAAPPQQAVQEHSDSDHESNQGEVAHPDDEEAEFVVRSRVPFWAFSSLV